MALTMVVAAVMAGSTAVCLGLVDAGRAIDEALEQLAFQTSQLDRSMHEAVERGDALDPQDQSRASVERRVDAIAEGAGKILAEHAPPYMRFLAPAIGGAFDLLPPADDIHEALTAYLDYADQASQKAVRSAGAAEIQGRLLDLNYDALALKISQARDRAKQGTSRALTALQFVVFFSIGIGAIVVGLAP